VDPWSHTCINPLPRPICPAAASQAEPRHLTRSPSNRANTDVIGCELDGDPIAIAFHPGRLPGALTTVGAGRACIALTTPAKAALITPAGDGDPGDDAGPGYRHLLMPIRTAG
jgi:hypothetical protein